MTPERFDVDTGYDDPWDPRDPEPVDPPTPDEYLDPPEYHPPSRAGMWPGRDDDRGEAGEPGPGQDYA